MKKIKLLFFLALSTLLTGCFNILEEVTLNQDGSGLYSLKMDLSAILADDFMKSMIQQSAEENEATKGLSQQSGERYHDFPEGSADGSQSQNRQAGILE